MFESFPTVVLISNFLNKSFFKMFCGDQLYLCALGKLLSNGIQMTPPNSGEFDPWFVRIQMEQSTLSRVEKS